MTKKKKRNKRKLSKRGLIVLIFFFILVCFFIKIYNINISNVYIKGNKYLSDQEIIDISKLNNYPKSISNLSYIIKKRLNKNKNIFSCKVHKNIFLNIVYIEVKENYKLFYYKPNNSTILFDGSKSEENGSIVSVINQIPNTIYNEFLTSMKQVNIDVLDRMSEIEYKPNEVDENRFFILMKDGNYVYLTLNKFLLINKYFDLIKTFYEQKGTLYLDSGGYFEVFN